MSGWKVWMKSGRWVTKGWVNERYKWKVEGEYVKDEWVEGMNEKECMFKEFSIFWMLGWNQTIWL